MAQVQLLALIARLTARLVQAQAREIAAHGQDHAFVPRRRRGKRGKQ